MSTLDVINQIREWFKNTSREALSALSWNNKAYFDYLLTLKDNIDSELDQLYLDKERADPLSVYNKVRQAYSLGHKSVYIPCSVSDISKLALKLDDIRLVHIGYDNSDSDEDEQGFRRPNYAIRKI